MIMHFLKQFFGENEYDDTENIVKLSYYNGKIDRDQIEVINNKIDGIDISVNDLDIDPEMALKLKMKLPATNRRKFRVIYLLVRRLMTTKSISENHRNIIEQVMSEIHHEKSRIDELIDSLISNLSSGNSEEDTFRRLEYLLNPRQVNFN